LRLEAMYLIKMGEIAEVRNRGLGQGRKEAMH
jgi:hypothetical protein